MLTGVIRGLQLIADFMTMAFKLLPTHPEAWSDFQQVATIWLGETCTEAGVVKVSAWSLAFNGDPWKGSRVAWQACKLKWTGVK